MTNKVADFNAAMDGGQPADCDCMPDCEAVSYELQVDRIRLPPPEEICRNTDMGEISEGALTNGTDPVSYIAAMRKEIKSDPNWNVGKHFK